MNEFLSTSINLTIRPIEYHSTLPQSNTLCILPYISFEIAGVHKETTEASIGEHASNCWEEEIEFRQADPRGPLEFFVYFMKNMTPIFLGSGKVNLSIFHHDSCLEFYGKLVVRSLEGTEIGEIFCYFESDQAEVRLTEEASDTATANAKYRQRKLDEILPLIDDDESYEYDEGVTGIYKIVNLYSKEQLGKRMKKNGSYWSDQETQDDWETQLLENELNFEGYERESLDQNLSLQLPIIVEEEMELRGTKSDFHTREISQIESMFEIRSRYADLHEEKMFSRHKFNSPISLFKGGCVYNSWNKDILESV